MTKRKAITAAMKVDCLIYRYEVTCAECGEQIHIGQEVEWDHVQALVHGGDHTFANLRPIHSECHKAKTARDIAAKANGDRLLGLTKTKPGRKIPSRPFQKRRAA